MEDNISDGDDNYCAVCGEIFLVPTVLSCVSCNSSFCSSCLETCWGKYGAKLCPLCLKQNHGAPAQKTCKEHQEKLSLFCIADLEPICYTCYKLGRHMNHGVCITVKEALEYCKVSYYSVNERCRLPFMCYCHACFGLYCILTGLEIQEIESAYTEYLT